MRVWRAVLYTAFFLANYIAVAMAQDVTLKSRDGAVELHGTLLGFDGEFYRIASVYGELTVDGSGVLCEGPGCPNLDAYIAHLRISGSSTVAVRLLPVLIEAYARKNDLTAERRKTDDRRMIYVLSNSTSGEEAGRFTIHVANSDEGFADLLADEADVVMSLREIRPKEADLARETGLGDLREANRSRVLALDAQVPVTAPGNPLDRISLAQLAAVFGGQVTNWKQLGGPDAPITIYARNAASGQLQAMEDRLLKPVGLSLAATVEQFDDDRTLADAVSRDPLGIGIISYSARGNSQPLVLTGTCGFSLRAERRTIKTEDYPLTAPMFMYLPARRLPKMAREFLAFTRSPTAQIVIRRAGFVDQAPEEIPVDEQGDRLANAISVAGSELPLENLKNITATLGPRHRLSTTFRFRPGSAELDAQSRSNVQQLARALEAGRYDNRELLFVGFSDGQGPAKDNLEIAKRRAGRVHDAVKRAAETASFDRVTMKTEAFGESLPMACDDTEWGRQVNRRVEVWVR